jgi:hypothetical protein
MANEALTTETNAETGETMTAEEIQVIELAYRNREFVAMNKTAWLLWVHRHLPRLLAALKEKGEGRMCRLCDNQGIIDREGFCTCLAGGYREKIEELRQLVASLRAANAELMAENERLKEYISLVEQEICDRELTHEGLKVWRPDVHENEEFVEDDFIAIRETLPIISGCGQSRPGALMHLAAAATLVIESMNDDALAYEARLRLVERERDEAKGKVEEFARAILAECLSLVRESDWVEFFSSTISDVVLEDAADYLLSINVLEKHSEKNWYRFKGEQDGK